MEKKYDSSDIITLVDRAFINFEKEISSRSGKSEQKINDDSHFNEMLTLIKFAIMGEIMSILKEEE